MRPVRAELARQALRIGRAAHARRISETMGGFVTRVSDPSSPLMTLGWHRGRDAASAVYHDIVAGRTDPVEAAEVTLHLPSGERFAGHQPTEHPIP